MILYGLATRKPIKNVELKILSLEKKPTIGKVFPIEISLHSQENLYFRYMLFQLLNERADKRSPMDKITSRSIYIYRFNVEKNIDVGEENQYKFQLRVPVHKEASRNDKFICIRWQLTSEGIFSTSEGSEEILSVEVAPIELEVG